MFSVHLSIVRVGCHGNTSIIQFNIGIGWNDEVLIHQSSRPSVDPVVSRSTELELNTHQQYVMLVNLMKSHILVPDVEVAV